MKAELIIFGITGLLVYNAYHDGKFTKSFFKYKKYIQMATYALVGLSIYLVVKKDPTRTKSLLLNVNNMVRFMPISRNTADMITPIFDFTRGGNGNNSFMDNANATLNPQMFGMGPQEQHILQQQIQPKKATKRSVSETKKKYVAYMQDWKCKKCGNKLNAWFEVDHRVRLENGGSNDVSNLVAMCRECHGEKTAMENM